jgi:hypothetical protein
VGLGDLVVGDAGEGVGEPGVGIDGIELGRFDQSVGDGGGLSACFGADEEVVLPSEGYGAHAAFGSVVIGHVDGGALQPLAILCTVMVELACRDRGVGVRRSGQAELTLSCELALLSGRPCDYPVCAASAYP